MPEGRAVSEERPQPAYGRRRAVTASASVILCRNPSPMTLEGTNTWLLAAPGHSSLVVVDPGPDDAEHIAAVADAGAGAIEHIVITHRHGDHTGGIDRLQQLTGAQVHAREPEFRRAGGLALTEGIELRAAGLSLQVLATPGHTGDSVSVAFAEPDGALSVITGDTILGRGSTILAAPDGDLGDFLDSMTRLRGVGAGLRGMGQAGTRRAGTGQPVTGLPGHGNPLADLQAAAAGLYEHRQRRLAAVAEAAARLGADATARAVTEAVYVDTDPSLMGAAEISVAAQLAYLRR